MFVLLTMSAAWNLVYGSLHGLDALPGRRNPEREREGLIYQSHFCAAAFNACSERGGLRGRELIFVEPY